MVRPSVAANSQGMPDYTSAPPLVFQIAGRISGLNSRQVQAWLTLGIEADAELFTLVGPNDQNTLSQEDILIDDAENAFRIIGSSRRYAWGGLDDFWKYPLQAHQFTGQLPGPPKIPGTVPPAPATPTGLVASGAAPSTMLVWNATLNTVCYDVMRSTISGEEVYIATSVGNSFIDTTGSGGMTYYYTVRARNGYGVSAQSNEAVS